VTKRTTKPKQVIGLVMLQDIEKSWESNHHLPGNLILI